MKKRDSKRKEYLKEFSLIQVSSTSFLIETSHLLEYF